MASWNVNPFSDAFPTDNGDGEFSVSYLTLGHRVTAVTGWLKIPRRCEVKTQIHVEKSDCNATCFVNLYLKVPGSTWRSWKDNDITFTTLESIRPKTMKGDSILYISIFIYSSSQPGRLFTPCFMRTFGDKVALKKSWSSLTAVPTLGRSSLGVLGAEVMRIWLSNPPRAQDICNIL